MVSAIGPALTGLAAAGKRLEVAAGNIANQNSTRTVTNGETKVEPYQPQEVVTTSLETGGVSATVRPSSTPPQKQFLPDHPDADDEGFVTAPGARLEKDIIESRIASYDYKANLKSLSTQEKLFDHLLDIIT